jgi:hypothetical protein
VSDGATAAAGRLADRLTAEGIVARAEGSRVSVAPEHWPQAVILAGLFGEVDHGRSRVAPPPTSSWDGSFARQLLAVVVLGLLVVPSVALALLALAG